MNNNKEIMDKIIRDYKDTFWRGTLRKYKKSNILCIFLLIGVPFLSLIFSIIIFYFHDFIFQMIGIKIIWVLTPGVSATLLMFGATISIFLYNNYITNRESFINRTIGPSIKSVSKLNNLISSGLFSFFDIFILIKDSPHENIKGELDIKFEEVVYHAALKGRNIYPYTFLSSEEAYYIPIFVKHYIMEHIREYNEIFLEFPELLIDIKKDMYHLPIEALHDLIELFENKKSKSDNLQKEYETYMDSRALINKKIKIKLKNSKYSNWDYENENMEISAFLAFSEVKLQKGELFAKYDTYSFFREYIS